MQEEQNVQILTKEGKEKLEKELKKLVETDRPLVIQEIKTAREQGDLSENAEFDAARQKQGIIEERISEIENILLRSKVITSKKSEQKIVHIGSKVELLFSNRKKPEIYEIVGSVEANPLEGKISNVSPIAMAIIGKVAGDQVIIENVKNKPKVKIISISKPS